jgi:hypothetical protein
VGGYQPDGEKKYQKMHPLLNRIQPLGTNPCVRTMRKMHQNGHGGFSTLLDISRDEKQEAKAKNNPKTQR